MSFINTSGDFLACLTARLMTGALNVLPVRFRMALVYTLVRVVLSAIPRFDRIARRNLAFVFPSMTEAQRRELIRKSCRSLARVFVDFARLPMLDEQWMKEHVHGSFLPSLNEIRKKNAATVPVRATGLVGSF